MTFEAQQKSVQDNGSYEGAKIYCIQKLEPEQCRFCDTTCWSVSYYCLPDSHAQIGFPVFLIVCLFAYKLFSVSMFVCLSVCLSVCLFVCLSVCPCQSVLVLFSMFVYVGHCLYLSMSLFAVSRLKSLYL